MLVSCVRSATELMPEAPAIVVFPEWACAHEVAKACERFPDAIVAAALVDNGLCRGYLIHRGQNRIAYLKLGSDGETRGAGIADQCPVYTTGGVTIGMLICMDVQNPELAASVLGKMRQTSSSLRVLCIPADMSAEWHMGDRISPVFKGINVAVCNHTRTYPTYRCKSFITDTDCQKLAVQNLEEPVHLRI